ncbi:taurine dioxygenase [Sphaerotilus hippei]|uniref:Taurine dioxygenase n=1 Tax=Sphaerotilus hippei TaxID=744406 RepID=A0A318H8J0_9BURK|nr:taurine dioxygenase [Sphaerotilus hippei]PXW94351.1 taurine dioxygenase [Sphaerotilus hippei]
MSHTDPALHGHLAPPSLNDLRIEPLGPAIGAQVHGIDLSRPISDGQRDALQAALLQHHVLFFERQPVTPVQQRDLARRFGELHVHPVFPRHPEAEEIIVLDTHADNLPDNDNWHTDVTFIATPPMGAILSARELPALGGDTLWASGIAAYEALSEPWRALLDPLTAEHSFVQSFPAERYARTPAERRQWEQAVADHPPQIHPVVRTHPVSGRRGLFVNEGFTTRIMELKRSESDAVLAQLRAHIAKPEFTVRWRWKRHDLAFWDNRLTQHYATVDYLPHRRVMHRATILGDRPC